MAWWPAVVALATARRMVAGIQSTLASAKSLVQDIADAKPTVDEQTGEEVDEWAWARTPVVHGKIEASIKQIETIIKSNKLWSKLLIGVDSQQVRRRRRRRCRL